MTLPAPKRPASVRYDEMSSAPSLIATNAPQSMARIPILGVVCDFGWVLLVAVVSLALGLATNHFAAHPLPIVYQSPEQRFDVELTSVINSPPLQIGPGQTLALPEFRTVVESKGALILDARSSVFFQQGHVPGALNLSRDNFAADYRRLSPTLKGMTDKPIIVYCSGGYCHDSKMVAGALMTLGFEDVRVFTGGWDEWSAGNLPVATGSDS
jgi:rhodanese-related sulfurtransferase